MPCSTETTATFQVPAYVPLGLSVDVEFTGTSLPQGWSMRDPSQIQGGNPLTWCASCYCNNGTADNPLSSPQYILPNNDRFTVTLKTYIEGGNNIGYNGWYINFSNGVSLFIGEMWSDPDCVYVGAGKGNSGYDADYSCSWDNISINDSVKGAVHLAKTDGMHTFAMTFTPGSNVISISVDGGAPVNVQLTGNIPGQGATFNLYSRNSLLCAGSNTTPGYTYTGPQIMMQVQSLKITQ